MKLAALLNNRGSNLYVHILDEEFDLWNGSVFETYNASNWGTYSLTLTEQGSSGVYVRAVPVALEDSVETLSVVVYERAGGSPAESDTLLGGWPMIDLVAASEAAASGQVASLAASITSLEAAIPTVAEITADIMAETHDGVSTTEILKRMNTKLAGKKQVITALTPLTVDYMEEDGTTVHFTVTYPSAKSVSEAIERV